MRKVNFTTLKNITTPESFIANTLEAQKKSEKKALPRYFRFSRLVAALCLTFMCVLGIVLYPVLRMPENTMVAIENTDYSAISTHTKTDDTNKENNSQLHSESTNPGSTITSTLIKNATQNATDHNEQELDNEETIKSPTNPPKPTKKPTTNPTKKPTSNTDETGIIGHLDSYPTHSERPTTVYNEEEYGSDKVVFVGSFSSVLIDEDSKLYCKVFDSNGNLLGDSNLFSSQHRAEILSKSTQKTSVKYCLASKEISYSYGYYDYVFYDQNGTVLYQSTQEVIL